MNLKSMPIAIVVVGGLLSALAAADNPPPADPKPDPALSPQQVVRIVMTALQTNDADDHGIETTFRFASPRNQAVTGPIERFKRLVKNPLYAPMLNAKAVKYGPARVAGDAAEQIVTVTGDDGHQAIYVFQLSKQADDPFKGCWMSDSVVRAGAPADPGNGDGPVKT